jgi:uncharacterized protein (DUF58 family)
MIDPNFLEQLGRFNLIIQKRVTSNYSGSRRSRAVGQGLLFEDHQPYASGEDYRRIDWKVYARTDDLFVRRFEEEKSLTVRILLDSSASMKFRKKWDYASMLAVGFAYLTMRENEKFQLATFDKDLVFLKAKKGRSHLGRMINELNNMKVSKAGVFLDNVRRLKQHISTKSLIVLISDFLYDLDEIEHGLMLLSKNELAVIHVLDEQELKLNYNGQFKLSDPESEAYLRTFISPNLRTKYQSLVQDHSARIAQIVGSIGGKYHLASTENTIFDVFYEILMKR